MCSIFFLEMRNYSRRNSIELIVAIFILFLPHCCLTPPLHHCTTAPLLYVSAPELEHDKNSLEMYERALTAEDISNWFSEGNPLVLNYLTTRSLGYLTLQSPLRKTCTSLMLSPWFDRAILICICANALFLAADNPLVTSYVMVSE